MAGVGVVGQKGGKKSGKAWRWGNWGPDSIGPYRPLQRMALTQSQWEPSQRSEQRSYLLLIWSRWLPCGDQPCGG